MHLIQMVCRWLWWWLYDANDDFLLSEWASECICFVEFVFGVIFNTWHLCCMHKHKAHAWDVDGAKSWEESAGGRDYVRHWFEMSMFLLLLQLSLLACAAFTTAQIRVFHYCFFISLIHFSLLVRLNLFDWYQRIRKTTSSMHRKLWTMNMSFFLLHVFRLCAQITIALACSLNTFLEFSKSSSAPFIIYRTFSIQFFIINHKIAQKH